MNNNNNPNSPHTAPHSITIQWPDALVEHFSHFFADQWDQIIAATLDRNGAGRAIAGYTMTALQSIIEHAHQAAEQALVNGFEPSWSHRRSFAEPPTDKVPDKALAVLLEILEDILNTDRRDFRARRGFHSLGDYFFESLRQALKKDNVRGCLTEHHAAAKHFGGTAYYAMILSGISADTLVHSYAEKHLRFPLSGNLLAGLSENFPDNEVREFHQLSIFADADSKTAVVDEAIFHNCEIGSSAFQRVSNAFFEDCELSTSAIQLCEQSTFKNCHSFASPSPGDLDEVSFDECVFYGAFPAGGTAAYGLHNCSFTDNLANGLHISTLSGDCSDIHYQHCIIENIADDTMMGQISQSSICNANKVQFLGALTQVHFVGNLQQCSFGDGKDTRIEQVKFGDNSAANVGEYVDNVTAGDGHEASSVLANCRFRKGVHFQRVSFECLLEDPVFESGTSGVGHIWGLRSSRTTRNAYQGIEFGLIETSDSATIPCIIGGSIHRLQGSVDHATHPLIRSVATGGRITTYEVVLDPIMRQQWQVLPSPILIKQMAGEIGTVKYVGDGTRAFAIDEVSGRIEELQPGLTICHLQPGAQVIFAEQTDIDSVLRNAGVQHYDGGQFGVWETNNGSKSLSYYFDPDDYFNRGRIEAINHIFDNLA